MELLEGHFYAKSDITTKAEVINSQYLCEIGVIVCPPSPFTGQNNNANFHTCLHLQLENLPGLN